MLTRLPVLIVAVLLIAQAHDLDRMAEAQLLRDLVAEIDDILDGHDPNEIVDEDTVDEILEALGDDGDAGDESEIDLADLEAEMDEADTNLEDVVEGALDLGSARRGAGGIRAAARGAAPPRRREAPSRVARALVMAIKSQ